MFKRDEYSVGRAAARVVGVAALLLGLMATTTATVALADGTEALGAPSITIKSGTGVAAAGTGLQFGDGSITIDVPAGAAVKQVLLYWEGHHSGATVGADDTIVVDGNPVTGTLIGGPTRFFGGSNNQHWSSTYRAEITSLALVDPGTNTLAISGAEFDRVSNGAGVLVIFDDGGDPIDFNLSDGNDLAFWDFASPLDTTVPVSWTFDAAPYDRQVQIILFASSVHGDDTPNVVNRPNVIEVTIDGGAPQRFVNQLDSNDGYEWDTVTLDVTLPANATTIVVQALSEDASNPTPSRPGPASFAWLTAAAAVPAVTTTTTTEPATTTTTEPTTTTTTTTTEPTTTTSTTTTEPATTTTTTTTTTTEPTTTTTTTEPATTTTEPVTTTSEPPATIDVVAFAPVCQADIPYIDYAITVSGTSADNATLTFSDLDGNVVAEHEDVPLVGEVIYPGASEDPEDWPGWRLNDDGFWVPDPADDRLRDGLVVEVEVNPVATGSVLYPPATSACNSPETVPPTTVGSVSPTTVRSVSPTQAITELPRTGSDGLVVQLLFGGLLTLGGIATLMVSRRSTRT